MLMYEKAKITNRKPYQSRDNKNGIQIFLCIFKTPLMCIHCTYALLSEHSYKVLISFHLLPHFFIIFWRWLGIMRNYLVWIQGSEISTQRCLIGERM